MQDMITEYKEVFSSLSPIELGLFLVVFLLVCFIPTFLGLIRNRKHIGKIFLLNIPLCFTFTGWIILMGVVLIKFDDFEELKKRVLRKKKSEDTASTASNEG